MKTFDTAANKAFWHANQASYQGDAVSEPLFRLVKAYTGRDVLDAGAGSGSLMRVLRRRLRGARVAGIDLAPKSDDVIEGDLADMPFGDGEFDTVFCCEVIEHLAPETTGRILDEIHRVMKPLGHLILTTPFDERLEESLVTCPGCGETFHRWGHQQTFRVADVADLLRGHGFRAGHVIPVKMSRLRRFGWFAGPFFRSGLYLRLPLKGSGRLTLVAIAQKA